MGLVKYWTECMRNRSLGNVDLYGVLVESAIPVEQYGRRVGSAGSNQQRI